MDEIRLIDGDELEKRIAEVAKAEEEKGNNGWATGLQFAAMMTHQQTEVVDLPRLMRKMSNIAHLDHSEDAINQLKRMLRALEFYKDEVSLLLRAIQLCQRNVSEIASEQTHS